MVFRAARRAEPGGTANRPRLGSPQKIRVALPDGIDRRWRLDILSDPSLAHQRRPEGNLDKFRSCREFDDANRPDSPRVVIRVREQPSENEQLEQALAGNRRVGVAGDFTH